MVLSEVCSLAITIYIVEGSEHVCESPDEKTMMSNVAGRLSHGKMFTRY